MTRKLRDFYFTLDLRSLALFRILLACLLLGDLFARWPDLEAFYTSFGALPVEADLPKSGGEFHFCLMDGVTSLPMVRAVCALGLVFYLLFLVGYRTRLFGLLSFVFFTSLISRATLLRDGSVVVLATMLMWSLFLPMGKRFSIDASWEKLREPVHSSARTPTESRSMPSLAAFVIVAQIGLIYFFTAAAKYGTTWKDGTALYYALNFDQLARPLGQWLAAQPLALIKALTWGTLVMEFAALPLFLSPFGQPWLRRAGMFGLALLHLSIALTTTLSFFSATMMSTYGLLLLPQDWEALERRSLVKRLRLHIAALLEPARLRLWETLRLPGRDEPLPDRAAVALQPKAADGHAQRPPLWWARAPTWLSNGTVALLFLAFNLDAYNLNLSKRLGRERITEPRLLRAFVLVPSIPHDWELFAPNPTKEDGWWVIEGETESGEPFDPLTGKAPTFDKPLDLAFRFDRFWRKYLDRIWLKKNYEYRLYFGKYVTRKNHRDKPRGERLVRFNFYFVKELTQPPGTPQPWPADRMLLWHHECFRSEKTSPDSEPSAPSE